MKHSIAILPMMALLALSSCARKEPTAEAPPPAAEASSTTAGASDLAPVESGPRAFIHLRNGTSVPGTIVASSRTDMILAGDDGIERKIPLGQIKSVEYTDAAASSTVARPRPTTPKSGAVERPPDLTPEPKASATTAAVSTPSAALAKAPPPVTTRTHELPAGSEISVRTNEPISSDSATEGQTFDAQVTRDVTDANGDVVIPRRSNARVMIRSAATGGRVKGSPDLVLDLQSVVINGKPYTLETADVTKSGKSGVGANRRTAEYTGGGAALGAIIGAIAGGGKGAAIGAASGAGAGALTQILTKGRTINVPVESVLTFKLDKPLRVTRVD